MTICAFTAGSVSFSVKVTLFTKLCFLPCSRNARAYRSEASASHLMAVYLLQKHDPPTWEQQEVSFGSRLFPCNFTDWCMSLGLDLHRQVRFFAQRVESSYASSVGKCFSDSQLAPRGFKCISSDLVGFRIFLFALSASILLGLQFILIYIQCFFVILFLTFACFSVKINCSFCL